MCADNRGLVAGVPSDHELLTAAQQGDTAALETLLVRYQPLLYRFGLRMCGNADDAGEVAQESLISMARSLRSFRGDASVSSWLYTIARRFCLKKRRRSVYAPAPAASLDVATESGHDVADLAPNPEQAALNRELAIALAGAIDTLDQPQREVLILRDAEGLSASEVAKVLGISVDAVKSRLHRARVAVRQQLARTSMAGHVDAPRSATCPDVVALFSQYLEGELDPSVCAAMEAHLTTCSPCRGACDSLKRTLAMCRELPTPEVPAPVAASVKAAIRAFLDTR